MVEFFLKLLMIPHIKAILVFVIFFAVAKLVYFFITHVAMGWAKKTRTQLDDIILSRIKAPVFYLIILSGIATTINIFPLLASHRSVLSKIITSIVVLSAQLSASRMEIH